LEVEAALRKPSDWEGEKWWRMTYSEDDEFDKKEKELEEFEDREKERRKSVWVEKRGREREKEQGKGKEKSNCGVKAGEKEEGKGKVELEGEGTELGGVILELEGEEIVELEEESGENVNEAENPDKSDNLKKLNTPEDAPHRPLYQYTSR